MTSNLLPPPPQPNSEQPSFTVESAGLSRKTTSTDKPMISSLSSQMESSTKKSGQDSTTSEKSLYPFWNKSCQAMSNALWSVTKTASLVSDSSLLSGSSPKTERSSWFSTGVTDLQKQSLLRISSPLSTSSAVAFTDSENTTTKSKRIRIYPDREVREAYRRWLAASRWSYNAAIAYLRDCWNKREKLPSAYSLRKLICGNAPDWVKSAPFNPRGGAVIDAHVAFKKCQDKQHPRFRSCREPQQSLKLQSSNFKSGITYSRELGKYSLHPAEPLPERIESDFSIVLSNGRWFICYAVLFEPTNTALDNALALDPGVRSFLTGFDGQRILEMGVGDFSRIAQLCYRLDKIQSQVAKFLGKEFKRKRWQLRKLAQRLRVKITNLVCEIHNQLAARLTQHFKHIFLPTFETSEMVRKKRRKIGSKTARAMLSWCHYRFKQVLKFHALKRGSVVHDVTEEYTSKTCSKCGHIHRKLGGNKKFICSECGHTIDRDWNGAINILFKSLDGLVNPSPELDEAQYTVAFGTCCKKLPG